MSYQGSADWNSNQRDDSSGIIQPTDTIPNEGTPPLLTPSSSTSRAGSRNRALPTPGIITGMNQQQHGYTTPPQGFTGPAYQSNLPVSSSTVFTSFRSGQNVGYLDSRLSRTSTIYTTLPAYSSSEDLFAVLDGDHPSSLDQDQATLALPSGLNEGPALTSMYAQVGQGANRSQNPSPLSGPRGFVQAPRRGPVHSRSLPHTPSLTAQQPLSNEIVSARRAPSENPPHRRGSDSDEEVPLVIDCDVEAKLVGPGIFPAQYRLLTNVHHPTGIELCCVAFMGTCRIRRCENNIHLRMWIYRTSATGSRYLLKGNANQVTEVDLREEVKDFIHIDELHTVKLDVVNKYVYNADAKEGKTVTHLDGRCLVNIRGAGDGVKIIKNIANIALALQVMDQPGGLLAIPDRFAESSNDTDLRKLVAGLTTPELMSTLRRPLQQAVCLTPLTALTTCDLSQRRSVVSAEEILLNSKRFGNTKPPGITALERVLWSTFLQVARGHLTATRAYCNLHDLWKGVDWSQALTLEDRQFFVRATMLKRTNDMSLCETWVQNTLPSRWAVPPAASAWIRRVEEPCTVGSICLSEVPESNDALGKMDDGKAATEQEGDMDVDEDASEGKEVEDQAQPRMGVENGRFTEGRGEGNGDAGVAALGANQVQDEARGRGNQEDDCDKNAHGEGDETIDTVMGIVGAGDLEQELEKPGDGAEKDDEDKGEEWEGISGAGMGLDMISGWKGVYPGGSTRGSGYIVRHDVSEMNGDEPEAVAVRKSDGGKTSDGEGGNGGGKNGNSSDSEVEEGDSSGSDSEGEESDRDGSDAKSNTKDSKGEQETVLRRSQRHAAKPAGALEVVAAPLRPPQKPRKPPPKRKVSVSLSPSVSDSEGNGEDTDDDEIVLIDPVEWENTHPTVRHSHLCDFIPKQEHPQDDAMLKQRLEIGVKTIDSSLCKDAAGGPLPPFKANPSLSSFVCKTEAEFRGDIPRDVQKILAGQNIVLSGYPGVRLDFNPHGLEYLEVQMDTFVDVQDQSVPAVDGNFQSRVRTGTLDDLYRSSQAEHDFKKSLNALYFPLRNAAVTPAPRGEGTWVHVASGEKLWVVAEPRDPAAIFSTTIWRGKEVELADLDPSVWKVEAILLRAGDMLTAICFGGHFLAFSCISRTVVSGFHTFFRGHIITNTDHPTIQYRMNMMACYLYKTLVLGDQVSTDDNWLPDILCREDLIEPVGLSRTKQSLMGSNGEGLDPIKGLERHDLSATPHDLRVQNQGIVEEVRDVLFYPILAQMLYSLPHYFMHAFGDRTPGDPGVPRFDLFESQLWWVMLRWPWTAGYSSPARGKRRQRPTPVPTDDEIFRFGVHGGDGAYFVTWRRLESASVPRIKRPSSPSSSEASKRARIH
ncbi:hypothetical protein BKA70DRAFT_1445247 [Coprinopsis sp. MPI-PUGE-AT-0042]|nr:hypothetical protein BKA70DRAFT_1445247 [Coprinopsis sp. MPI-PUGE-AT-0042]